MALTFPLSLANFLDKLPVAACDFDLSEAMQADETGGGEQLLAELGARVWTGRYLMAPMTFDEATAASALIDLIRAPGRAFLATDLRQRGPRGDPLGVILGAATPTVTATQAAGREITIAGLPAGYVLAPGDMLSFVYATSKRALHRVVVGGVASGGGTLAWAEVIPAVRTFAGTPAVTLLRPVAKAVIQPGTFQPGEWRDRLVTGMSFGFAQTTVA
jgi:hypothetical protein